MSADRPQAARAWGKWLRFAWQNARRNQRRSLFTAAIAALGTAAMLMATGFALSTYRALAQATARDIGHLVIARADQFERDEEVPLQHGITDEPLLRQRLLADAQVRHVLPKVEFGGLVSNGEKSMLMLGVGVEPDSEFAVKGPFLTMKAGGVLASNSGEPEVMLGDSLARSLKAQPGSGLTLLATTADGAMNAIDVTVKGVFATGVPEMDKRLVYTDVTLAQRLLGSARVSSLGVFLDRMESTAAAQQRLAVALPQLQVRAWQQQAIFYGAVRSLYNRIFGALGLIIAVIVVFVITNAMAMAIVERTREIGTLRALGTLPAQLTRSFALEGLVLGGGGALAGAALALGVSMLLLVVPVQMPPPPGRSQGYPLIIAFEPLVYLGVVACVTVLAMLASAWVARKAVRMPVVDALNHT